MGNKPSRIFEWIKLAISQGKLKEPFTAKDVNKAIPRVSLLVAFAFLPKHREGNPFGHKVYFVRVDVGLYKLK